MSLRANRYEEIVDIRHFLNEVAEIGSFVYTKEQKGSQPYDEATLIPNADFIGVLLCNVVNIDLCRYSLNYYSGDTQVGGRVSILTKGWIVMRLPGRCTYPIKHPVYINPKGKLSLIQWGRPIGRVMSTRDEDGFAKIELLPQGNFHEH